MEETQKRIFESLIAFVKEERDAYQDVLNKLESAISLNGSVKPAIKQIPNPVKTIKPKSSSANGKMKFSKFLMDIFMKHPDKYYDLSELAEQCMRAIECEEIIKPAGILKDEISKRLYQFTKRGDVIRSDNGYKINQ